LSYRSFKHLLGETSLERKCRYIFAAGILVLVTGSFYWYGQKTESLVFEQTTQIAQAQVDPTIWKLHYKAWGNRDFAPVIDALSQDRSTLDDLGQSETQVINPYEERGTGASTPGTTGKNELSKFERDAIARIVSAAEAQESFRKAGTPRPKPNTFANGTPMWDGKPVDGKYKYVQAVLFQQNCLTTCHANSADAGAEAANTDDLLPNHMQRLTRQGKYKAVKVGDLACVVVVSKPMKGYYSAIAQNRAFLIATALVTAILAMIGAFFIVRYVIVKPVKHLRDVSDAIAAGKLTIRAQIQTGDEFEELSHAFNRMLHNLVAMQQELREVNGDLDKKVDELAQANLALFEMNRLKSDFLATMSHELRTPLNSIIGFSEVLSGSDQINERQRRYASNIQTSGKMLLGMINDILDLAKIESGKMEVRTEDFSLRDVCEGLTTLARPITDGKNITLECRLDEAIPLLRQDPGKLRQIIYNLLSNAIKFTPEGGRITLHTRVDGRFAVIEVEDTGIGIAEEDREKIFEKFRQAGGPNASDGVLTREHQGTGLGLSIVRELTKLLGGDVALRSQPGQGSTFTIRIPLQLPGNRKFEVSLSDERIDLTKARRVEPRGSLPLVERVAPEPFLPSPHRTAPEPAHNTSRDR
jgi:two-component system, NarL family, sensor histidine kinase BarA